MKRTNIKMIEGYISIDKACEMAGITRKTFYNWIEHGLPVTLDKQLNKQRLVNEVEWITYLKNLKESYK
ncbi:MAG TPA: helix-turn-helix domain-containing protein [Taishania sp.]|nr:helix-turn-helix domain-containing protein [Taishania sp.]